MGRFDVFANVTVLTPPRHATRILGQVGGGSFTGESEAGASLLPHDAGLV